MASAADFAKGGREEAPAIRGGGTDALPRLELRVERLQLTFRLTLAFHAREVRFEVAHGEGAFERIFPETFSFHSSRHDPTELFLQLDDLLTKSRLLGGRARYLRLHERLDAPTARQARLLQVTSSKLESTIYK